MTPSLESVLTYNNPDVVSRFLENNVLSHEEAEDIFLEMKRWLWLCTKAPVGTRVFIQNPLIMVDNMWHTFILFTKEYENFCNNYLGIFIHHHPVTPTEREVESARFRSNPKLYQEEREKQLQNYYFFVCDTLGRDVFVKWYFVYDLKYNPIPGTLSTERKELLTHRPPLREIDAAVVKDLVSRDKEELISILLIKEFGPEPLWGTRCGMYCACSRAHAG